MRVLPELPLFLFHVFFNVLFPHILINFGQLVEEKQIQITALSSALEKYARFNVHVLDVK